MFAYKIFGLQPGFSEGLVFNSCVPDLQNQPELWLDECPYLQPHVSSRLPQGLRVALVDADDDTFQPAVLAQPAAAHQPLALAA